jgi:hypothetical protein
MMRQDGLAANLRVVSYIAMGIAGFGFAAFLIVFNATNFF